MRGTGRAGCKPPLDDRIDQHRTKDDECSEIEVEIHPLRIPEDKNSHYDSIDGFQVQGKLKKEHADSLHQFHRGSVSIYGAQSTQKQNPQPIPAGRKNRNTGMLSREVSVDRNKDGDEHGRARHFINSDGMRLQAFYHD